MSKTTSLVELANKRCILNRNLNIAINEMITLLDKNIEGGMASSEYLILRERIQLFDINIKKVTLKINKILLIK